MLQRNQSKSPQRARGERLSRALVLDALAGRRTPIGAYALRDALSAHLGRSVSPFSVYRIMRALEDEGRIRRVESSRGWMRVEAGVPGDLMLICSGCQAIQPVPRPSEVDRLLDLGGTHGYVRLRLVLEVVGLCAACQTARATGQ